jgi:hypothetical protein
LGAKLNEQFNPASGLKERLADLDKLRELGPAKGGIGPDVFAKARDNAVRDVAERLGLGGETRLPGAALVGSTEDARLIQQFRAAGPGQTTEDLLRQIRGIEERMLARLDEIAQQRVPRAADFGGGGDF